MTQNDSKIICQRIYRGKKYKRNTPSIQKKTRERHKILPKETKTYNRDNTKNRREYSGMNTGNSEGSPI